MDGTGPGGSIHCPCLRGVGGGRSAKGAQLRGVLRWGANFSRFGLKNEMNPRLAGALVTGGAVAALAVTLVAGAPLSWNGWLKRNPTSRLRRQFPASASLFEPTLEKLKRGALPPEDPLMRLHQLIEELRSIKW
jgi:hypothetical protein